MTANPISIHPLEKWRRAQGYTQAQVGRMIFASPTPIARAEANQPIRRKYIDRLLALAPDHLKPTDFKS